MQEMATSGGPCAAETTGEIVTILLTLASQENPDDAAVQREIAGLEARLRGLPHALVFAELRNVIAAMSTLQRLDCGRAVARLYAIAASLANRLSSELKPERLGCPRRLHAGNRLLH